MLEDLLINVGVAVSNESSLDSLIGKLLSLEELDPVDIDVNIDVDDKDLATLAGIATLSEDIDFSDIDVNIPDGGIDSDGGTDVDVGSGKNPLEELSIGEIRDIETSLGPLFDPRGLINKELDVQDLVGGSDTPIFDIRNAEVDTLIGSDRSDKGVERLIDFDSVMSRGNFDSFTDLVKHERGGGGFDDLINLPEKSLLEPFGNIRMESFHNALAQVIPLLLTFALAMPAAIAGVMGLGVAAISAAGALTALGGLTVLGGALMLGGGDLQTGFEELQKLIKEDILDPLKPLARRFDDLFVDALNGFEQFMQELALHGRVLTRLKDDARDLGQFLMTVVPPALSTLTQLTDAFAPVFALIGEWMSGGGFSEFLTRLVSATRRALPYLVSLASSFMMILPFLFDLSMGFLMVTSAVMRVIGVVAGFLDWLGPLGTTLGLVIGATLAFASAGALLFHVGALLSPLFTYLSGTALAGFITSAWASMTATLGFTGALIAASVAAAALLGILTFGLAPLLGAISNEFLGISDSINKATDSLKGFENMKGMGTGVGGLNSQGGLPQGALNVYEDNSSTTNVSLPEGSSTEDAHRLGRRINYDNSVFRNY